MCQKLVQLMQGKIWVVQNPRGFPQRMALDLRFQLHPSLGIVISEPGDFSEQLHHNSLFNGLHVLLADDDDVNRAVTQKLLQKLGCTVTSVSSGFECLSAFSPSGPPHKVVLLDLHLPDLDGFEVAIRIRRLRSRSSWPSIIAMTSNASEDVWERIKQTGINGVVQKPILLQGIINELRRVLLLQANKTVL
ncbi:hypothetical protein Nepgr_030376 [Nepenthes gracilis]|uniref:Response regulatory domain-containing protein n=1 Tax=Nepenthes gracilis TaxID=150966 RepID=A0AAD3TEP9_NEPGR|nr:hypothetical protein Nepgr_030376 [Nepenthes gracilis]